MTLYANKECRDLIKLPVFNQNVIGCNRFTGFTITNPYFPWLTLTADIGLTVSWDCNAYIKVTVSGKYKNKLCPSSLCGNNNGNWRDDNQFDRKCAPPPGDLVCFPAAENRQIVDKCHLMNTQGSPFTACNGIVDPTRLIANCKYDACRCQDPMKCVCSSFAAYSERCAAYGKVVNWRFQGTYLYPALKACGKCKHFIRGVDILLQTSACDKNGFDVKKHEIYHNVIDHSKKDGGVCSYILPECIPV
jgi:hypothetical protein